MHIPCTAHDTFVQSFNFFDNEVASSRSFVEESVEIVRTCVSVSSTSNCAVFKFKAMSDDVSYSFIIFSLQCPNGG